MWLKILLCIAIIAFSTAVGYLLAGKYRARKKFYEQFCLFNKQYLNELSYTRKPLPDFLKEHTYTGDFAKAVKESVNLRDSAVTLSYLTNDEKSACSNYLSMLGKGDAASQKSYFGAQTQALEAKFAEGEQQAKARGSLYLKLGVLLGLAIVILII